MKTMKLAATKAMATELNNRSPYTVTWVKMPSRKYSLTVDCDPYWNHGEDYNAEKDEFRVIAVYYPECYYANPDYVTTRDLADLFHTYHCKNLEDLAKAFNDRYEI